MHEIPRATHCHDHGFALRLIAEFFFPEAVREPHGSAKPGEADGSFIVPNDSCVRLAGGESDAKRVLFCGCRYANEVDGSSSYEVITDSTLPNVSDG